MTNINYYILILYFTKEDDMRFFHKFQSLNYNFVGLIDGILLNAKRKNKYTSAIEYLKKYEYALDKPKKIAISDKYPDKIWQCWFQGKENMPSVVKMCTDSVRKYYGEKVVFLDKYNMFDYIELPDYIIEKYKRGIIPHANFSDMLRLSLLAKYGGVWIDATIYLSDRIPDKIFTADFFSFRSLSTSLLKDIDSLDEYIMYCNNFNSVISFESPYFLSAKSGNDIVNGVLALFLEYWKKENSVKDYLMIDKFFILTILHNKILKEQFLNMPEYYFENLLLLQHTLFEQFDMSLYDSIAKITPVHKLTHKNLKRNPYKNSFLMTLLTKPYLTSQGVDKSARSHDSSSPSSMLL